MDDVVARLRMQLDLDGLMADEMKGEVEAKRKILDLWERTNDKRHDNAEDEARAWLMDEVVEALALPYSTKQKGS